MNEETRLLQAASALRNSKWVLVFTGAGISTGSGIPDFRGPDGIWTKWRPVYFDEFLRDPESRLRHWKYKSETWRDFRHAQPNPAHRALVDLDNLGYVRLLVTQNIDGLHQLAGHAYDRIVELHGTNRKIECVVCGALSEPDPVFEEFDQTGVPPECHCGGFLKPATISFGQAMPSGKLHQAMEGALKADFVLSIGSTLEVEPAASVPRMAKETGAFYVIINKGETAHDHIADVRISDDAAVVLPRLVEMVRKDG